MRNKTPLSTRAPAIAPIAIPAFALGGRPDEGSAVSFVPDEVDAGVPVDFVIEFVTTDVFEASSELVKVKLRANSVVGRACMDVILMVGPAGCAVLRSCRGATFQTHSKPPLFQSLSVLDMLNGI